MPLSGNKGEWSEIYVFLKLLSDGKLNAADASLNAIPNIFYPIIKILRQENGRNREYKLNGNIQIIDGNNNSVLLSKPIADFINQSKILFDELKVAKGSSFSFPLIEQFLNTIDVNSLSAISTDKSDIKIVVHDLNTGMTPTLGFSIKSMLGKDSTLFNAGNTTNFIFEVCNVPTTNSFINSVNQITTEPKILSRIQEILKNGGSLCFKDISSQNLKLNLQLIDSDLPKILANLLILRYTKNKKQLIDLLSELNNSNPLSFDLSLGHPFYEYKLKNFLTDSALGMTPATLWTGKYDATGGIIIVKEDGEIVCYHIYNRNEFQDYLLNNTRLEQASTSRYGFGDLYIESGKVYLKLNLQIRFK